MVDVFIKRCQISNHNRNDVFNASSTVEGKTLKVPELALFQKLIDQFTVINKTDKCKQVTSVVDSSGLISN